MNDEQRHQAVHWAGPAEHLVGVEARYPSTNLGCPRRTRCLPRKGGNHADST